ncbi:RluA family pseudouridine synthase [Acetonema longum]|uniref:Pseudouridine synthase n=1 Tax=Acetonema longum DSM 6540 TaxID=1009370 RepID=F7NLC9_9FIRM|nr:RluA family pseudouridine synthase [Acetonema longum]EGO63234.1 pseudouridine synthase, RluA family protein [Acetonema longum DSM 6540]
MSRIYTFTATEDQGRLDSFVTRQLQAETDSFSRSHVQKLIEEKNIKVNGKETKAKYSVQSGDTIEVIVPKTRSCAILPEEIPLDILYEDDSVIVINKPRGMVVHPAAGNFQGTLVNALLDHCRDLSGINGVVRPGIVHRLDKDTSGVMVAAKNDTAHLDLADQIQKRIAGRKYFAVVWGNIKEEQGVVNAPIGRHPADRKKMAVVPINSKPAVTHFRILERFRNFTLIECKLETGRTHQIRVHMAYIGYPVVGDPKYGPKQNPFAIAGQALHSAELTFVHPMTKETLHFTAPLPQDMTVIINQLREDK